jgi:hypothetical protein
MCCWISRSVGGVTDLDDDFMAFVIISSETDRPPLRAQRALWSPHALQKLKAEFAKTEA